MHTFTQPQKLNKMSALTHAKAMLLEPYRLDTGIIQQALSSMQGKGIDDSDLYFQHIQQESWVLEEGIVKTGNFSIDQGVGLRIVSQEKTAFAYSDTLSPHILLKTAKELRSITHIGHSSYLQVGIGNQTKPAKQEAYYYDYMNPVNSMSNQEKIHLLEKIDKLSRASDPRIQQVMASVASSYEVILMMRVDGFIVADIRPMVRLSIHLIAEENGQRESGVAGGGGRVGLDYFNDNLVNTYIHQAVNSAVNQLQARPAPAGEMDVVLGSGWPGVMLHEAVGHGLEGDFNRKGSSTFSGKLGERVAAPGVTILDDGTLPNRRGSLNIDDEGHPTQANVLIEDGILKGYMQDRLNARLMKTNTTGNARRQSYAHLPMPRMTNTYMIAGDKDPQEIINSLKRGVYATNFGGGQVDITSGKFVFSASEAYWVENGKIQYPVKGATLIGSGPEAMQKVTMIGNDLALDSGVGVCGKEGQSVPVGVGQPTLRIDGLVVGGTG